jgi:outer membrane scaffolding protein for murein synthesis (MipA/OmpV family)
MKTALVCLAAAAALAATAVAKPRPVWEIGVGGFATYSPAYYGASESSFGGFPVAYVTYRGDDFSILSSGLFDVDSANTKTFDFGLSLDFGGSVDSEDRLFLGDIDFVGEIGPRFALALYQDGNSRLEVALAGRAAFEWDNGYVGYVIQPEVSYKTSLSRDTRIGFLIAPKFGFDGYNDLYYSTPFFDAENGYIGTDLVVTLASDITERLRFSASAKAIAMSGAKNIDSPLYQEDWNFAARVGFTYAIWQSDEMTAD